MSQPLKWSEVIRALDHCPDELNVYLTGHLACSDELQLYDLCETSSTVNGVRAFIEENADLDRLALIYDIEGHANPIVDVFLQCSGKAMAVMLIDVLIEYGAC